MKALYRSVLGVVLLSVPSLSQVAVPPASSFTYRMSNGRFWNELPKNGRLIYLIALRDTAEWKVQERGLSDEEFRKQGKQEWVDEFTVGEYTQLLDELYKQPENVLIPIPIAVKFYCTPKLTGTFKTGDLEALLIMIRTVADSERPAPPAAAPPVK